MNPWAFKGQISGRDMENWLQENERPRGILVRVKVELSFNSMGLSSGVGP